ncbi:MAG: thioredoxin domain-containing protein [Flavobacteriaceae bacterium]
MSKKFRNELALESSPYLLQHAHNPVNWKAWSDTVFATAKKENKLLLISIGYSTCHWCHVMETECFENDEVAKVMNDHFINIKVDREERPDVDQVYMNALQLMTGSGGWPLNIVALPDGRPVWGATYLHKDQWIDVLMQLQKLYKNQVETLVEYADQLEQGIRSMDVVSLNKDSAMENFNFEETLQFWARQFDLENGGTKGAPKFMMPNNYHFLLRYGFQTNNKELLDFVHLTLNKMAFGGIFDHINGGFSRYSVDERWHIPHFEKMLYDNAQLVSLYCDAYLENQNPLYKEVVFETLEFVNRELTDKTGGFYNALDADSINEYGVLEEGAYYVFTKEELQEQLQEDFPLFEDYYNINDYGEWEKKNYVLIRNKEDAAFCSEHQISIDTLSEKKKHWKTQLQSHRKIKARPRLDYKTLTSWNGLMMKAFVDGYRVFKEPSFLETALKCGSFVSESLVKPDGCLYRSYTQEKAAIDGFLDDYAFIIEGFISLYETTFDQKWIDRSQKLIDYCYEHFYDENTSMFYYTSKSSQKLISKTTEFRDNVIPSSNSVMAKNLFWLGTFFNNKEYLNTARQMLLNVLPEVESYPPGFSNWLDLSLNFSNPFYEIAICGEDAIIKAQELNTFYIPNKLLAGSLNESEMPLLTKRFVKDKTLFYVCKKGRCGLPNINVKDALQAINFN